MEIFCGKHYLHRQAERCSVGPWNPKRCGTPFCAIAGRRHRLRHVNLFSLCTLHLGCQTAFSVLFSVVVNAVFSAILWSVYIVLGTMVHIYREQCWG